MEDEESGGQQQYCLKWNNYQESLSSTFSELLASDSLVDVTLSCDGHQVVRAHRLLLSACSPYFRQLLSGLSSWEHPVIVLQDVQNRDLQGIVHFIYHGEVSIDQECLPSFLAAAESLRIRGLTGSKPAAQLSEPEAAVAAQPPPASHQSHIIHPALQKLVTSTNTLAAGPVNSIHENNNITFPLSLVAEEEEREGGSSEEDIQEKGMEQQAMYHSFFPADDSDPSKELGLGFESMDPSSLGGEGGKKTCPFCLQQLSWHALSRHIRDMHRAKSDVVICQYCRKTFRNKNSLGCHIWRFHKRGKELIGKDHPLGLNTI